MSFKRNTKRSMREKAGEIFSPAIDKFPDKTHFSACRIIKKKTCLNLFKINRLGKICLTGRKKINILLCNWKIDLRFENFLENSSFSLLFFIKKKFFSLYIWVSRQDYFLERLIDICPFMKNIDPFFYWCQSSMN